VRVAATEHRRANPTLAVTLDDVDAETTTTGSVEIQD